METTRFPTSNGEEILNGSYIQNPLDAILYPEALAIIEIPGRGRLDSLEAKRNHLADTCAQNAALKGINGQISVIV